MSDDDDADSDGDDGDGDLVFTSSTLLLPPIHSHIMCHANQKWAVHELTQFMKFKIYELFMNESSWTVDE